MNIGNILKVADAIEGATVPDLGFYMGAWIGKDGDADRSGRGCGTTACVAGWAFVVENGFEPREYEDNVCAIAAQYFGLDSDTADCLFVPTADWLDKDNWDPETFRFPITDATPEEAARVLRNLAITGKVDWEAAMKPADPAMPPLPVRALPLASKEPTE